MLLLKNWQYLWLVLGHFKPPKLNRSNDRTGTFTKHINTCLFHIYKIEEQIKILESKGFPKVYQDHGPLDQYCTEVNPLGDT